LQLDVNYSNYLRATDKEEICFDSIAVYLNNCYSVRSFSYKYNAFEMFKNSGMMRFVTDQELLLALWEVYIDLSDIKTVYEWLIQNKWSDIGSEMSLITINADTLSEKNFIKLMETNKAPMYNYYIMNIPAQTFENFDVVQKKLEETLLKLEKSINK
jgi:hypothetical protein